MDSIEIRIPALTQKQRDELEAYFDGLVAATRAQQPPPRFELTDEQRAVIASQSEQVARAKKAPGNVVFVCDDDMRALLRLPADSRLPLGAQARANDIGDLPGETPGCKIWRRECVEENSYGHCLMWDWFCND